MIQIRTIITRNNQRLGRSFQTHANDEINRKLFGIEGLDTCFGSLLHHIIFSGIVIDIRKTLNV